MHASSSGGIGVCGSSFSLSIATARGNGIGWVDDDTKREEAFLAGGLSCRDAVDGGALTFISWGISSGAVGDLLLVDLFCRWTVDFVWAASLQSVPSNKNIGVIAKPSIFLFLLKSEP